MVTLSSWSWGQLQMGRWRLLFRKMGKMEEEPDTLVTFNRGALIGLLVVAVAVAMVIIISLLLIRRKPYGTISHGIIEVEASRTPEDKHLSKMQNQGYENPTYRYLEENN